MHRAYGTDELAELHASEFLGGAKTHLGLLPWQRIRAAQWLVRDLAALDRNQLLLAAADKDVCAEPLATCWVALCQEALARTEGQLVIITDLTDG